MIQIQKLTREIYVNGPVRKINEIIDALNEVINDYVPKVQFNNFVNTVNVKFNAVDTAINKNRTDIATNKANITVNTNDIAALKTLTNNHTTQINANRANIQVNANDIAALKALTNTHTTQINTNRANIQTNAADIAALKQADIDLRKYVDKADFLNMAPKIGYYQEDQVQLFATYNISNIPLRQKIAPVFTTDNKNNEVMYYIANGGGPDGEANTSIHKAYRPNHNTPWTYYNTNVIPACLKNDPRRPYAFFGCDNHYLIVKMSNNTFVLIHTEYTMNEDKWMQMDDISSMIIDRNSSDFLIHAKWLQQYDTFVTINGTSIQLTDENWYKIRVYRYSTKQLLYEKDLPGFRSIVEYSENRSYSKTRFIPYAPDLTENEIALYGRYPSITGVQDTYGAVNALIFEDKEVLSIVRLHLSVSIFNTNTNEKEYVGISYPTLSFHVPQRILQGNPGSSTITLHNRRGDWSEVQTNFMTDISTKLGNDRGYYANTITNSSYDSLNHMAYRTGCETTSKAIRFCQLSEDDVIQDDPRLNGLKYCYVQPYFYILDAALWGKSLGCGMAMWDRVFISAFNSKGNHIVWVKNWKFYKNHESELCVAPQPGEYYDVTPANFASPLREPIGPSTIFQVPAKSTRKFYTADTFTVPKGITSVRMTINGNAARYFDAQYFDGSIKVREFTYTETNVNDETRTTDFTIKANQILNVATSVSAANLNTGDNTNAVLYGGFVAYNPMANMFFLWGTLDYGNVNSNQNIGLTHIVGVRSNGSIVSYGQPKDHPFGEERRNTEAEYFDPYMPVGCTVIDPNQMMVFFHARTNGGRRCKFVIYEFSNNYTTVTLKRIADYNGNIWDKTLAFPDMARHHCLLYSGPKFGFCGQVHTPAHNSDHKIDIYMQRKLIGSQPEERDNDVEAILNTFGAKTDLNVYKMFNSSSDGLVCYIPAVPIFLGGYYSMMQETIEITLQPNLNKDRPHSSDGYYDANYVYLQRDPDDRTKITASTMPIRIITEGETVFQKILVAAIQTDEEKPIDTRFYTINTGYNDWKFHGAGDTTPIGTIIMWYSETNPASGVWLDCNGQDCSRYPRLVAVLGSNYVPNMQGLFPRSIGSQEVESTVHDGGNLGTKQGDAIRNITGTFDGNADDGNDAKTGVFYNTGRAFQGSNGDGSANGAYIAFDASRVVPTANENRPASISMRFLIKAE